MKHKSTRLHNRTTNTSKASSANTSALQSRDSSPAPRQPFRFLQLPAELRVRVYEELLCCKEPIDLHPENYWRVYPRLAIFLVSKQVHEEAYRVFYAQTVRLFPEFKHGRFFYTKKPLLARLSPRYRRALTNLELILGPGWTSPPKGQCIQPSLGLGDCTSLRALKIFVTCDPSDSFYNGFRGKNATEDTYKWFCVDLLREFIEEVPSLEAVELDAHPDCVKKDSPLVTALLAVVRDARIRAVWGPRLRSEDHSEAVPGLPVLESAMARLGLDERTFIVRVEA